MAHLEGKYNKAYSTLRRFAQNHRNDKADRVHFDKDYDQFLKCLDCAKWTLYGKTCKGVCEP